MEGDSGLDMLSNDENDGILDIIPPSEYDPFEAKFCASLFWLVFHATEDGGLEDVPSQVTSPIQRVDKKNGFVVHPEIVEFLCKGEVYCTVCTRIFPGKVTLAGHWSVIQTLSRNSVYVVDGNTDIAVTDASLEQKNPFHQGAHIALMDALMTAYSSQVVSIQKVVQAVRRFSTFSASRELPFDLEDALLLWVNKTNMAVNSKYTQPTRSSTGKLLRNREQVKKAGLRAEISEETALVSFPVIDDILKGLCDGRSLLGVLMFYEPSVINIEDICCSSVISTEDSIRNLDVFLGLCSQYFCTSVLALKVEDILYGSPYLKINIVALLAEIFSKCEGNVEAGQEITRSKTSCSENGDVRVNGHDSDDGGSSRSHSAPVSRLSHSYDKLPMSNTMPDSVKQDRNIALKIQNYVENESVDVGTESSGKHVCLDKITSSNVASSNEKSANVTPSSTTSLTMASSDTKSSNWASSDGIPSSGGDGTNTVEVQGVVVKLRKRLPRSVEPGGGHEALHSRRMKKSLCGWSREDVPDIASQTSDNEEQFDVKSDEVPSHPDLSQRRDLNQQHPLTTFDHHESHHSLNLDLNLPEDDPPVDMLSPISETTEPGGSPGNSLNNSMSSSHDQQESLHKNLGGAKDFNFTPPEAQTPRKSTNIHPPANDDLVPRGSYIITDVNHTPESAIAAGIPVVERELMLLNSRGSSSTIPGHSSDGTQLYRSSFSGVGLTNGSHKDVQSNLAHERSNIIEQLLQPSARESSSFSDQRYHTTDRAREQPSNTNQRYPQEDSNPEQSENESEGRTQSRPTANHWSERRGDNRFSTFTKSKTGHDGMDTGEDLDHPGYPVKDQSGEIRKENSLKTFAELENAKINSGPPITWFGHVKNEEMGAAEFGGDGGGHRVMPSALENGVRKTNWGEMASEMNENSNLMQKDRSDSAPMADSVSRELNLLRLRLAEKQRDIEAQKQLTKEQLEEERKRFGQNVFWLAVCKGRDKKEGSECDSPKKTSTQAGFEQRLPTISTKIGKTSNLDSSTNSKFASFTKHSSLDEELPPSMGKLQDRTFNMKTNNNTLSKNNSIPEEKTTLPNEYFGSKRETNVKHSDDDRNTSVEHWNPTFEDRDMSEDVVQFRLSRQAPRNQSPAISFPGNSENESPKAEKPKTPVLNYKSRINVPVSFHAKPNSENSTAENSQIQISENFTDRQRQGNENFFDMDTKSAGKPPTSPHRKCWDTVKAISDEPCIAASKSSHHLLDQNDGSASKDSQRLGMHSEGGGMGSKDYVRSGSEGLGRSEDDVYMETGGVKQSPDEGEFESGNLNSSPVDEEHDMPKKGLALFIGEENTVSNDGLTPEQVKKREKFLRNRQQKIEEDKMKKDALLEKKRRKEEKMREIQLRREQEEKSRHDRLQEKQKQAEHAKRERQQYEMRRKENLRRTNFIDESLGVDTAYATTGLDIQSIDKAPGGHGGCTWIPTSRGDSFQIPSPVQTTIPAAFSGFTGVQSYVKPSGKTNRKLIINAISHVCLPGAVNKDTKEKCLQAMTESSAQHFLILFKEGLKFRALYSLALESNQVLKVHGIGPRSVTEKMIDQLYKYNSGGKEFTKIPAKGFSLSVDGFTLQKSCWQSNKPPVPSKTSSNFKQATYRSTR